MPSGHPDLSTLQWCWWDGNIWCYTVQCTTRLGGSRGPTSTTKVTQDTCGASWRGSWWWPNPWLGMRERLLVTSWLHHYQYLGTVENHGNTEITETVIFVKCRDFAKTLCLPCFGQNAVFLRFYNNILFLISVSWSLLCDFNTTMFYICLCDQS